MSERRRDGARQWTLLRPQSQIVVGDPNPFMIKRCSECLDILRHEFQQSRGQRRKVEMRSAQLKVHPPYASLPGTERDVSARLCIL